MRVLLQRVSEASVRIDGEVSGAIGKGLLLLVGFTEGDVEEDLEWMADKVAGLRIFRDGEGRMNEPLSAVDGSILVVSQFTLYGDTRKGRRPSFVKAAQPDAAIPLYDRFVALLKDRSPGAVETVEFGAMMDVHLVNDGPVTLMLERGPSGSPEGG